MTLRMALAAVPDAGPIDAAMATSATADPPATRCEDTTGPIDAGFANLCAEHCHQGQQSDHAPALTVPAAMRSALYITASTPEPMLAAPCGDCDECTGRGVTAARHPALLLPTLRLQTALR